jgi:hypothetical protein
VDELLKKVDAKEQQVQKKKTSDSSGGEPAE